MRKNIKRYTAILLIAAMVFPSSPVYGNMEDEYELLLESKDSEEYQKATDSNAQKNDEDEDIHEDEELIDDIQKASPSDAEEKDKDEVELEQNLETEKKIVSWKWNDKQEALIDGELQLAVTEVDQISFDDVVSMLPESITAEVLEDGKTAEAEIFVSGWNCNLYKTDEEGKWPTEGEYLFEAEMPDEYELDAGTDELSVKVTLEDPGVMLLEDMTSLTITDKNGQTQNKFSISGNTYTGNGYTIIKETQENQYKLVLDGIDAQSIKLKEGIWTVELKNSNTLSGGSTGFYVESSVGSVTFTGDGKLDITATNNGFIQFSKVTIALQESGKITSYSSRSKEQEGGFCIYRGSTLNIENGTLEAKGGKYGLVIAQNDGKIYMLGGEVIATGVVCAFEQSGFNTLFQQTGGVITCNGMIKQVNPDSKIIINGGKMIADGNLMNGGSFNLQSGEFVLNGNCMDDGPGTFVKTGGTLSGTGNLRQKKLALTIKESSTSQALSVGSSVTPDSFFDIPSECGILTYSVTNETGSAHIDNGKLIADSVGTVKLKVTSADTNFYKSAEKEIELSVEKGTLQNVVVTPYSGTYDGVEHDAVTVTVGGKAPAADMKIRYAKVTDTGIENFTDEMPKVKNCSDSGIQYKVEISGDNYMTQVFTSTGINISKYNLAYASLALSNSTFTYNGQEQIPDITAAIMKNGNKLEVIPDSSYSISYKKGSDYCENPTDVGTYAIILTAKDTAENYTGTKKAYYNITKQDLKDAEVTISGTYVYHGSPVEPEPSQIRVVLNGLLVNASEYEVEYANNDAIGAAIVLIKAKDTGNYVGNAHGTFEILDPKTNQGAVSSQVTVAKNSDAKTFTATIQAIDGAEYSFDGVTWSDNNQKTDCQPSTAYSAFIRMKETDTAHVSPATELKFTTPEIKQRSDSSSGGGSSSSSDSDSSSSSSGTAKDPVRGNVTSDKGIITGANNSMANDGYSHWMQDEHGWWLHFANNSYPKGAKSGEAGATYAWELVNGNWWAFDENGYIKTGWLRDDTYGGWFYADPDTGMKIGWVLINGKWYYFHPTSDGKRGIMYAGQNTPDGYYVDETGAWDGKER